MFTGIRQVIHRIPRIKVPYWYLLFTPYLALGLGLLLNAIACGLNHAQMPVLAGYVPWDQIGVDGDTVHVAMSHATHLKFICDWIVINGVGVASPGDIFEWMGEATTFPALISWITCVIKDFNG